MATGVAVYHADHTVGVGLGAAGAELIEQRERELGLLACILEALAPHVHLTVVHQAEGVQVHVAHSLGEGPTLLEVAVRGVEPSAVGAHHAQIVVGDGAAVLIAAVAVRCERALIAGQGLVQLPLDVGDDPQVLLHAGAELPARATELQGPEERLGGFLQGAVRQIQTAHGVQRFRGEHIVANPPRHAVTPEAQLAGLGGLVTMAAQNREPPQRFGQHDRVAGALGRHDRGLVPVDRLRDAPGALPLTRCVQRIGAAARVTRRWHSRKSGGAGP